ncbi:MAG: polysaccharide export outer membrane protein [Arenicella sp.]|jgi:polysaccharide export outer membrane protein
MKRNIKIIVLGLSTLVIQSCGINSNLLLRTDKDYQFADVDSLNATKNDYQIDKNDILQLRFFTNDGFKLLDIATLEGNSQNQLFNPNNSLNYVIQNDSMVNLPVLGKVNLVGESIREAEKHLSDLYSADYVDPFVQIAVTNRRVIVFPGNGGEAQVLYMANNNVTLLEALALAGGVAERGRANRIKLIRKTAEGKRRVYKIDLSTIDGLAYADIIVQANDYIYVEPDPELGREILGEVAPVISLISSAAVIVALILAP